MKRTRAELIIKEIASHPFSELSRYLHDVVCGQINFTRYHNSLEFLRIYKRGSVSLPAPSLHLDIERSIAFIEKHCATLAMVEEFMGSERFDQFMLTMLAAGNLRLKPRHRTILENPKFLGVTALGVFLILMQTNGAIAGGLICPAPVVPLSFQVSHKFPLDIVNPTPAEPAYFNNIGDGCFEIQHFPML